MKIDAYRNIPQEEIELERTLPDGRSYTLNHPDELVVPMKYQGDNGSAKNSQGWEESRSNYFQQLQSEHPEYFSKENTALIKDGKSPYIDQQFTENLPQYEEYTGEKLIHHHVGGDGQAVAVPQSIHRGYGEIHNPERDLGIRSEAEQYSAQCKQVCENDPSQYGKTSDELKGVVASQENAVTHDNDMATEQELSEEMEQEM